VNPRLLKIVAGVALGLVIALGIGWLWGSGGRWAAQDHLASLQEQHQLTEARARLLAAQVDLYKLNFGAAASNLERARQSLEQASATHEGSEHADLRAALQAAVKSAEEARRLAAEVNQGAQASAERALSALQRAESLRSR
jgi:hypothetical protein